VKDEGVMAGLLADGSSTHRHTPSHELVIRAMREFDEWPTLRITLEQATRLFSIDRATCQDVLDTLVEARVLGRDCTGRYARVDW
jgi:Fe2+ or Zn2+ uptake regulation protein